MKKDSKKPAKSLRAKEKTQKPKKQNVKKFLKRHKLTEGDLVFLVIMAVVAGSCFLMAGWFSALTVRAEQGEASGNRYLVDSARKPNPKWRLKDENLIQKPGSNAVRVHLPILMYHRVDDTLVAGDRYSYGLTVPVASFEAQLKYLKDNGYTTVSMIDLYEALAQTKTLPPKSVILTFDDGTIGNYTYAYPLLKKYGYTGTFFVIYGYMNNNATYLNKEQAREMAQGGMDIQSHTVSHPSLVTLPEARVEAELGDSRREIAALTGRQVYFLAYPYGSYDSRIAAITQKVGYLLAVTTKGGKDHSALAPFDLTRVRIQHDTPINIFADLVR